MNAAPVTCSHCGASLEIPDTAEFVTCRYCNSQLEVQRSDSAITTVLRRLDQNAAQAADDLHALRCESEIERLDREWDLRRQGLAGRRRDGSSSAAPAAAIGYIMIIMGGIMGVVALVLFSVFGAVFGGLFHAAGAPGFVSAVPCVLLPLFVLVIITVNTIFGIYIIRAAHRYQQEEQQYLQRRQQLLAPMPVSVPPPRL